MFQYDEPLYCPNGYKIGVVCDGSSQVFTNPVTNDISVLNDGKYDIAWAHKIEPNKAVTIRYDLPVPYKVCELQ